MQIAWYSPTHDKIAVQSFEYGSETLVTFDLPLAEQSSSSFITTFSETYRNQSEYFLKNLEWEMFYGQGFHWLEQGLWVRLGEV